MKSVEKISDILQYDNEFPVEFVIKQNVLITEDTEYIPKPNEAGIPRFSLKGLGGVEDIEINKPMEATEKLIITAIKYGMLMSVQYKGEKDEHDEKCLAAKEKLISVLKEACESCKTEEGEVDFECVAQAVIDEFELCICGEEAEEEAEEAAAKE